MAYKQEPCPLCGRDMTAIETHPGRGELYCGYCDLTIGGNDAKTPEELIGLMDGSEHRQLKAENAKLRELMYERAHKHAIHHMTEDELRITAANVMDENAKLRELVRAMKPFLCCMPFASCNTLAASVRKRMSELGIEVSE